MFWKCGVLYSLWCVWGVCDLQTVITADELFGHIWCFFLSPAASVVQQNAATLFYCEAPELFCGLRRLTWLYILSSIMRILKIPPGLNLNDDTGLVVSAWWSVDWLSVVCFFSVKYLNAHTGIVFLRFPKSCYRLLWSALPFITSIETRGQKIPCFLNCLHVGGGKNIETHFTMNHLKYQYNTNERYLFLQEQLERVRSFWFVTTNSSFIECCPRVKQKVRDLI